MPNIKIVIAAFFLIVILGLILWLRAGTSDQKPAPIVSFSPSPQTTPASQRTPEPTFYSDEYIESALKRLEEQKPLLDQDQAVGRLLEKLPYKGTNFSLEFNYDTVDYVATISKDKQVEGNQEFDSFLKANGVQERSWIKNLVIK